MTSRCGDEEELLRLLDGELTENDAVRLREHVRGCGVCSARSARLERTLRDLKAPLSDTDPQAAIEEVMRRLPTAVAQEGVAPSRPRRARWGLVGGGLAAVLALSAVVVVRTPHGGDAGEGFQARGAAVGESLARGVGVGLYRVSHPGEDLAQATGVRPDDAYGVKYRNLLAQPVYLLAFAVDAAGTVHWVSPAYLDPRTNPASVALSPSSAEVPLASAMQLEAPADGPMRFVAVLSSSPLHVDDVDDLRGADLATASLRARWPAADVRELVTVNVASFP